MIILSKDYFIFNIIHVVSLDIGGYFVGVPKRSKDIKNSPNKQFQVQWINIFVYFYLFFTFIC